MNSKSMKEFGYRVSNVGSKGGKNNDQSAAETGKQILKSMSVTILDKLDEGGVNFSAELVSVLKGAIVGTHDKDGFEQKKWAVEQGLKIGVLGGYAAEKVVAVNVELPGITELEETARLIGLEIKKSYERTEPTAV